tara:strand:+ start:34 stop:246 length:213 start_codon:yes stop_codon:yes gene_type:complete
MPLIEIVNFDSTNEPEVHMKKLLASFAKNPTVKLIRRIENYVRKHPFSQLGLTESEQNQLDDILLLAENI